jgi:signal transduction histidine kinase/ligand-binding sensor domain-containing protein
MLEVVRYFRWFICLVLVSHYSGLYAQENAIKFRHLNVEDGLSQSFVKTICQDKVGFIWIGTDDGLNRFDGKNFLIYKHNLNVENSLLSSQILCIYEDSRGNLWIGTSFGLNQFDRRNNSFVHDSTWPEKAVRAIYEDKNQVLWIGASFSMSSIDLKTNTIRYYTSSSDKYTDTVPGSIDIYCFYEDSRNNIWIGSTQGISVLNKLSNRFSKYNHNQNDPDGLMDDVVFTLWEDKLNRIWAGSKPGIDIITNSQEIPSNLKCLHLRYDNRDLTGMGYGVIQNLFEDSKHNLYISSINGGLYILKNTDNPLNLRLPLKLIANQNQPDNIYSINSDAINFAYEDKQSNIWVGTYMGGLNYFNTNTSKFEYHNKGKDPKYSIINNQANVFLDEKDYLWIGTEGGLSRYNKITKSFTHFTHNENDNTSIGSNAIWALYRDKQNRLWVGGWDCGLNLYNDSSGTFHVFKHNDNKAYSISSNHVFSIFEDSKNNLWIGTVGGYLNLFDRNKKQFSFPIKKYSYYEQIKEANDGKLWLVNSDALECYDPVRNIVEKYQRNPKSKGSISSDRIFTIYVDSRNNLWVGTDVGLNLFLPLKKQFKYFQTQDGLPDNSIKSIIEDKDGNIWMGTNNGVSKFVHAVFLPEKPTFKNYTKEDGLQSDEFVIRAVYKGTDGRLYFGGNNGFNIINPDNIKENTIAPEIVFTEITVFYQPVKIGSNDCPIKEDISIDKKIELKHWQSVFNIKFAALNFIGPEKNQYAYKMVGFDKNWNYVGTKNEATYTNLEPGNYTFRVKASNNDGYWNEKGVSIEVRIHPPWWKTWWFLTFIYLFAALLVVLFINFRIRFYRRQNVKLTGMVRERTMELEEVNVNLEEKQEEISNQNEELKAQRDELEVRNFKLLEQQQRINLQNEELKEQHNSLETTNALLTEKQIKINQQNEELMSQRDALEEANRILEEQKAQIVEQNQELDKHRNDLENLVEERTHELIAAKEKAEVADRLKSSFLANLSHEIRTPLNSIIGFSNLVIEEQTTPDEKEEFIRIIENSSESLLSLINDIIDFSKIESGHIDILTKEVSLRKLMKDIQIIFDLQLKKQQPASTSNLQFRVAFSEIFTDIYLETDEIRVRQILSNLVHNAIKFTKDGFVEVGCTILGKNEMAEFYVKDTGIGIREEHLESIFDRFIKIETDINILHRGAGIGLTISKQLVNLLGGQIRVESVYGKGTTFYFTIPVKKKLQTIRPSIKENNTDNITDFKNVKVLVAEDDLTNYIYIEKLLKKFKINVIRALNGSQAVFLVTNTPDIRLVLMDIKMPELDGVQALQKIREKGISIPIIAQTAYALSHEIVKLKEEGFDDYLSKPLNASDIQKVLNRWIKV